MFLWMGAFFIFPQLEGEGKWNNDKDDIKHIVLVTLRIILTSKLC